jgi:hypothetical protein
MAVFSLVIPVLIRARTLGGKALLGSVCGLRRFPVTSCVDTDAEAVVLSVCQARRNEKRDTNACQNDCR